MLERLLSISFRHFTTGWTRTRSSSAFSLSSLRCSARSLTHKLLFSRDRAHAIRYTQTQRNSKSSRTIASSAALSQSCRKIDACLTNSAAQCTQKQSSILSHCGDDNVTALNTQTRGLKLIKHRTTSYLPEGLQEVLSEASAKLRLDFGPHAKLHIHRLRPERAGGRDKDNEVNKDKEEGAIHHTEGHGSTRGENNASKCSILEKVEEKTMSSEDDKAGSTVLQSLQDRCCYRASVTLRLRGIPVELATTKGSDPWQTIQQCLEQALCSDVEYIPEYGAQTCAPLQRTSSLMCASSASVSPNGPSQAPLTTRKGDTLHALLDELRALCLQLHRTLRLSIKRPVGVRAVAATAALCAHRSGNRATSAVVASTHVPRETNSTQLKSLDRCTNVIPSMIATPTNAESDPCNDIDAACEDEDDVDESALFVTEANTVAEVCRGRVSGNSTDTVMPPNRVCETQWRCRAYINSLAWTSGSSSSSGPPLLHPDCMRCACEGTGTSPRIALTDCLHQTRHALQRELATSAALAQPLREVVTLLQTEYKQKRLRVVCGRETALRTRDSPKKDISANSEHATQHDNHRRASQPHTDTFLNDDNDTHTRHRAAREGGAGECGGVGAVTYACHAVLLDAHGNTRTAGVHRQPTFFAAYTSVAQHLWRLEQPWHTDTHRCSFGLPAQPLLIQLRWQLEAMVCALSTAMLLPPSAVAVVRVTRVTPSGDAPVSSFCSYTSSSSSSPDTPKKDDDDTHDVAGMGSNEGEVMYCGVVTVAEDEVIWRRVGPGRYRMEIDAHVCAVEYLLEHFPHCAPAQIWSHREEEEEEDEETGSPTRCSANDDDDGKAEAAMGGESWPNSTTRGRRSSAPPPRCLPDTAVPFVSAAALRRALARHDGFDVCLHHRGRWNCYALLGTLTAHYLGSYYQTHYRYDHRADRWWATLTVCDGRESAWVLEERAAGRKGEAWRRACLAALRHNFTPQYQAALAQHPDVDLGADTALRSRRYRALPREKLIAHMGNLFELLHAFAGEDLGWHELRLRHRQVSGSSGCSYTQWVVELEARVAAGTSSPAVLAGVDMLSASSYSSSSSSSSAMLQKSAAAATTRADDTQPSGWERRVVAVSPAHAQLRHARRVLLYQVARRYFPAELAVYQSLGREDGSEPVLAGTDFTARPARWYRSNEGRSFIEQLFACLERAHPSMSPLTWSVRAERAGDTSVHESCHDEDTCLDDYHEYEDAYDRDDAEEEMGAAQLTPAAALRWARRLQRPLRGRYVAEVFGQQGRVDVAAVHVDGAAVTVRCPRPALSSVSMATACFQLPTATRGGGECGPVGALMLALRLATRQLGSREAEMLWGEYETHAIPAVGSSRQLALYLLESLLGQEGRQAGCHAPIKEDEPTVGAGETRMHDAAGDGGVVAVTTSSTTLHWTSQPLGGECWVTTLSLVSACSTPGASSDSDTSAVHTRGHALIVCRAMAPNKRGSVEGALKLAARMSFPHMLRYLAGHDVASASWAVSVLTDAVTHHLSAEVVDVIQRRLSRAAGSSSVSGTQPTRPDAPPRRPLTLLQRCVRRDFGSSRRVDVRQSRCGGWSGYASMERRVGCDEDHEGGAEKQACGSATREVVEEMGRFQCHVYLRCRGQPLVGKGTAQRVGYGVGSTPEAALDRAAIAALDTLFPHDLTQSAFCSHTT